MWLNDSGSKVIRNRSFWAMAAIPVFLQANKDPTIT